MGLRHIAAHIAFRRRVRHHLPQRAAAREFHCQGLFVLQICRQQESPRHSAPQGCRRHRIAVMAADSLIHQFRCHRRIDAHALRRGFYQMIPHCILLLKKREPACPGSRHSDFRICIPAIPHPYPGRRCVCLHHPAPLRSAARPPASRGPPSRDSGKSSGPAFPEHSHAHAH